MTLNNKLIFIVSNEPWGDVWFSKHNWAYELSKSNEVYFINSPGKWSFFNLFKKRLRVIPYSKSLNIVTIINAFPAKTKLLKKINNYFNSKLISNYVKKRNKEIILWSFTPLVFFNPKLLNCTMSFFHIVDEGWKNFYGTHLLAKRVDALFFVSEIIVKEYDEYNKPKLVIPHGISPDEFNLDNEFLNEINLETKAFGNYGLFVGSIDKRLDFLLLKRIIESFPKINFVFIGPLNILPNESGYEIFNNKYDNLILLGPKPYKILKYYIHFAHFCISPMDMNHPGNNISHHKTIPYLTQGKPIFSPQFKAYKEHNNLMYMTNNYDEFIFLLSEFIEKNESNKLMEQRVNLAKQHSYVNIKMEIESFLSIHFKN